MEQTKRQSAPSPSPEHAKLIEDLGGAAAVARAVVARIGGKLSPQAVSNWKTRGIPFRYRAPLAIEARERGIGAPANFLGEQAPPAPPPPVSEVPFL